MESKKYDDILFILSSNTIIFRDLKRFGIRAETPCKGESMLAKILRGLWIKARLPGRSMWYSTRINDRKYSIIIVLAGFLTTGDYLLWLRSQHPESRIILTYDDPVARSIDPATIPAGCCEVQSWDAADCEKYGMKHIRGYFLTELLKVEKQEPEQDVLFIGKDKGRAEKLLDLEEKMHRMGLRTYFHICPDYPYQRRAKPFYKDMIPYPEVRGKVARSRAVLDYLQEGQSGASIRSMECLFNQIKLITNNVWIKKMDFYQKENIFLLGEDPLEDLPAFLDEPFHPVDPEIVESYDLFHWLDDLRNENESEGDRPAAHSAASAR